MSTFFRKLFSTVKKENDLSFGADETSVSDLAFPQNMTLPIAGEKSDSWNLIPLGLDSYGNPILWDVLEDQSSLLSGSAGSGKSVSIRNMIHHTISYPSEWFTYVFCWHQSEAEWVIAHPLVDVSFTESDITNKLRLILVEATRREEELLKSNNLRSVYDLFPAILIAFDEYDYYAVNDYYAANYSKTSNSQNKEIPLLISKLARIGKKVGIHLILSVQRCDSTIADGELKHNITSKIMFGRSAKISLAMLFGKEVNISYPDGISSYSGLMAIQNLKSSNIRLGKGYYSDFKSGVWL